LHYRNPCLESCRECPHRRPQKVGSYEYKSGGGWREVHCQSDKYLKAHFPPLSQYQYSIKSNPVSFPGFPFFVPMVQGDIWLSFLNVGSETDSQSGRNAFSIQTNTNYFQGTNLHQDWVQFSDQSKPGVPDTVCVNQWDLTAKPNGYSSRCVKARRRAGVYGVTIRPW
jgi:hypothetical protein